MSRVESAPIHVVPLVDAAEVAREASSRIAGELRHAIDRRGRASIALSGGNTPRDTYVRLAREPDIDWTHVTVVWVDERAVAPTDDRSNYRWAKETLLDAARIPPDRVHPMPAEDPDCGAASHAYELALREAVALDAEGVPSIDVVVLGIGDDGHTASLFPGEPTVHVRDRLVACVPAATSREPRMTLTPPVLEHARAVFVLAVGAAKRPALQRAWSDQGDLAQTPARVIRECRGDVTWIVDRAAADG